MVSEVYVHPGFVIFWADAVHGIIHYQYRGVAAHSEPNCKTVRDMGRLAAFQRSIRLLNPAKPA